MYQRDPWTTALVIFVSIITLIIGIHNLEWGLNAIGVIHTMPSNEHRKHLQASATFY